MTHRVAVASTTCFVAALLGAFVAWPLTRVLLASVTARDGALTLRHYAAFFTTWPASRLLVQSLALAVTSSVITVGLAAVLAYAVTRTAMPGRRLVSGLTLFSLFAPPFLVALAMVLLLGPQGVGIPWLAGQAWSDGFGRLVVAQVLTFLPHAYLIIGGVLATIDGALEEAAENLGARERTILTRVILALARPGLVSAALTVFVLSMADFANPVLVGGRYDVLATEVFYRTMWRNDVASAATVGVVLLGPCIAAYLLNVSWRGARCPIAVPAPARGARRPMGRALGWSLAVVAWALALALAAVHGTVVLGSVVTAWGSDWSLSATHYVGAGAAARARALWGSFGVAALAAVLGTLVALALAYVIERMRPPGGRVLAAASGLPAALPGTVVGLGYLLAFHWPLVMLTGTIWPLAASIVFWKLPVAVLAVAAALRRMAPGTEETAVSLGAGAAGTLVRVTLPLLAPTALAIGGYFFIEGIITVSPAVFLIYRGFSVGSVEVLAQVDADRLGAASAVATIMVAIVGAVVLALRGASARARVAMLEGLTMKPGFGGRGRA